MNEMNILVAYSKAPLPLKRLPFPFREALPPLGARLMHPILLRRQEQEQTNIIQCTMHYQYLSLAR